MNSDDNGSENPVPNESGTSRVRTQSECSAASDDGANAHSGKRQRTTSQQFMVASGLTAASPPKFVSLEDIMKAANGMKDMALVHQIAVDKDFRLERAEPPPNTVEKVVRDTMHRAFWDILKEELAEDPPNYTRAFTLLENIKDGLYGVLLLPQHIKIKQQIQEILDSDLIKQQAENGALDFNHYAQYVISIMEKLCAPIRDEKIKQLKETVDVIQIFKGILETLDLMALDMANFTIEMVRPDIIAHSVELERKKFADYLAVQPDGLQHTRTWLLKHLANHDGNPNDRDPTAFVRNLTKQVFAEACIELLEWNGLNPYPETFLLDEGRLSVLELSLNRVILIGTILLVSCSNVSSDLQSLASFKDNIKQHASILLQSVSSEKELPEALSNIAVQVVTDIKQAQEAHGLLELSDESEKLLKDQLLAIANSDHRIRQLVRQRVKDFLLQIILSSTAALQKVPSGLASLQKELTNIAGQFLRIVSHNSTVFCIYYTDIVANALSITV
uniref:T-complex protein 11-like protein 1 n=1 Tax=Photinus pyralis TaxID=7054 RepID=A0A1Y1KKC3_PHOPY